MKTIRKIRGVWAVPFRLVEGVSPEQATKAMKRVFKEDCPFHFGIYTMVIKAEYADGGIRVNWRNREVMVTGVFNIELPPLVYDAHFPRGIVLGCMFSELTPLVTFGKPQFWSETFVSERTVQATEAKPEPVTATV